VSAPKRLPGGFLRLRLTPDLSPLISDCSTAGTVPSVEKKRGLPGALWTLMAESGRRLHNDDPLPPGLARREGLQEREPANERGDRVCSPPDRLPDNMSRMFRGSQSVDHQLKFGGGTVDRSSVVPMRRATLMPASQGSGQQPPHHPTPYRHIQNDTGKDGVDPDVRMAGFRQPLERPDTPWLPTVLGPLWERSWPAIGTKDTRDL